MRLRPLLTVAVKSVPGVAAEVYTVSVWEDWLSTHFDLVDDYVASASVSYHKCTYGISA